MHKYLGLWVIALIMLTLTAQGQDEFQYTNLTYVDNIKTVRFGPEGYVHLFPILRLNDNARLVLSFDDMDAGTKDYVYRVIHCDRHWEPSDLTPMEYIDGFEEENIRDFEFSSKTYAFYTNYQVAFPNDYMDITKSGNYLLVVYEDEDNKIPVITRRFVVVDRQVTVSADVVRPAMVSRIQTHQEIDFKVDYPQLDIRNPRMEVSACVIQNGRWDNAVMNLEAKFTRPDQLIFDYQNKVVFEGGNEFRFLDLRGLRSPHLDVDYVDVVDEEFVEAVLKPLQSRAKGAHLSFEDINGGFIVETFDQRDSDLSSEYPEVLFTYKVDQPYFSDHLYLFGALTEWQLKEEYRMRYNPAISAYVGRFSLKQGYYNYYFVTAPSDVVLGPDVVSSIEKTEGSHADTRNDYHILVYYRPFGSRYDQLIGTYQFDSQTN